MRLWAILAAILSVLVVSADDVLDPRQEVTCARHHQLFFSEVRELEGLAEVEQQAQTELARLPQTPKGEFETSAEYGVRVEKARSDAVARSAQIAARRAAAERRIEFRRSGLDELVALVKMTMGHYDADNRSVELSASCDAPLSWGTIDGYLSRVSVGFVFKQLACTVEHARAMRDASDRGSLYGTVRFVKPKLKLLSGTIEVPRGEGSQLAQDAAVSLLEAFFPAATGQVSYSSATCRRNANIIEIPGWGACYLVDLRDGSGGVIATAASL